MYDMKNKIYVHEIISGVPDDPYVSVGDLLFSTKEQRAAWATHWTEGGADSSVTAQLEALYNFGLKAKEVTNAIRPISSPYDVIVKLAREKFKYPSFHWVAWPLDGNKRHMVDHSRSGNTHYMRIVTKLVPSADELPAVEAGGGYILIYMGPPEAVLGTPGAVRALRKLCERENITDVLFRKYAGNKRITYSVRAGEGYYKALDGTTQVMPFDDDQDLSWFHKKGVR